MMKLVLSDLLHASQPIDPVPPIFPHGLFRSRFFNKFLRNLKRDIEENIIGGQRLARDSIGSTSFSVV